MKIHSQELESIISLSSHERRKILIEEMGELEDKGLHCFQCTGVCCTFVANSMQTTVLETIDLLFYLWRENRINEELVVQLKETVSKNRLDSDLGNGQRNFLRRTYTCPFYGGGTKGCSISRSSKPYGCLGFNACEKGVTEGGNCASNIPLLEKREAQEEEEEQRLNRELKEKLGLFWEKLPMPFALLELLERVEFSVPIELEP